MGWICRSGLLWMHLVPRRDDHAAGAQLAPDPREFVASRLKVKRDMTCACFSKNLGTKTASSLMATFGHENVPRVTAMTLIFRPSVPQE